MDEFKMKVTQKEMNGNTTKAVVTFSNNNVVTFSSSITGADVDVGQIISNPEDTGKVIMADGQGHASWEELEDIVYNIFELTSNSGTLSNVQLTQAQEDNCYIKLTLNGESSYFRKYLQTETMIYFIYAPVGNTQNNAAQVANQHIAVTISTRAYTLSDGEILETYNKEQIDSSFAEVDITED